MISLKTLMSLVIVILLIFFWMNIGSKFVSSPEARESFNDFVIKMQEVAVSNTNDLHHLLLEVDKGSMVVLFDNKDELYLNMDNNAGGSYISLSGEFKAKCDDFDSGSNDCLCLFEDVQVKDDKISYASQDCRLIGNINFKPSLEGCLVFPKYDNNLDPIKCYTTKLRDFSTGEIISGGDGKIEFIITRNFNENFRRANLYFLNKNGSIEVSMGE